MPHGEGSSKQVDHSDTVSPLETYIDEVFRDFWTVGGTVKEVISTHPKEVEREPNNPSREVREILVGRVVILVDRGPPHFNAMLERCRCRTMPFLRTRGNTDASIIPTRDIPVMSSSIRQHTCSYGDKVIVENHAFNHISRQSRNL